MSKNRSLASSEMHRACSFSFTPFMMIVMPSEVFVQDYLCGTEKNQFKIILISEE
jgi:hypothetical protein